MSQLKVFGLDGGSFLSALSATLLVNYEKPSRNRMPSTVAASPREFLSGLGSLSRRFLSNMVLLSGVKLCRSDILRRWHDLRGLGSRSDFLGTQPFGFFRRCLSEQNSLFQTFFNIFWFPVYASSTPDAKRSGSYCSASDSKHEPPPRLKARGLFWEVLICVALAKYWR